MMGKGKSQATYKYIDFLKNKKNKINETEETKQINININYYIRNIEYNKNMLNNEKYLMHKNYYRRYQIILAKYISINKNIKNL